MDYEKKYKKALERAATELETCGADESLRNMIYAIFPDELKESEDEQTRKGLINFLKSPFIRENICDWKVAPWIAWLEKQKYTQRDVDDAYLKGVNDTKNILENRGKQTNFFQNVSLTEFEEALADVCRGWIGEEIGWKDYIVKNANALLKICQKMWNEVQDAPFEYKPAWNYRDEKILKNLIDYFSLDDCLSLTTEETIDWLKSLKDRLKGE